MRSVTYGLQEVRDCWQVPKDLTVTEWAEKHRMLTAGDSSEPGLYNVARTPYLEEVMNACATYRDTTVVKATQSGGSEAIRNFLGYCIDQDPGPILVVLPDQKSVQEVLDERIGPMIRRTPALARYVTGWRRDMTRNRIRLSHIFIHIGYAGSAQSLASRPCRYVVLDEVDKYPPFTGREADPISLAQARMTTYQERARLAKVSSPTTRDAPIWKSWENCPLKMRWYVPCLECGRYMKFTFEQLRWPPREGKDRGSFSEEVRLQALGWYECSRCGCKHDDDDKDRMMDRGKWVGTGQRLAKTGRLIGKRQESTSIAFHIPGFLSPWLSFSIIAAEAIKAKGDPIKQMGFRNSILAEPFEQEQTAIRSSDLESKVDGSAKARTVPTWASLLIATADTQIDHFWFIIRAWGPGGRSQLIDHGRCESFEDLHRICVASRFGFEDKGYPLVSPRMLFLDAGGGMIQGEEDSRTHQVYLFAQKDPARVMPLRGHGGTAPMGVPFRVVSHRYTPPGKKKKHMMVSYLRIDVDFYKDVLARRIKTGHDSKVDDRWEINDGIGPDYLRQMSSEHKILIRKGNHQVFKWMPMTSGSANHLWDCEVYQGAAADLMHAANAPTFEHLIKQKKTAARSSRAAKHYGLTTPDGRPFLITDR